MRTRTIYATIGDMECMVKVKIGPTGQIEAPRLSIAGGLLVTVAYGCTWPVMREDAPTPIRVVLHPERGEMGR